MQVLAKRAFREYAAKHPAVAAELFDIYNEIVAAEWEKGADVRAWDPSADYVGGDRWVINVGRNRHRLVVRIFFPAKQVYVRFLGTHAEYDRISDITTV
ncbi:type II toxin-antitoxin system HigB family toxin [Hymenobacter glacieicola]|uniref:Toxin RelE n=1 Tax=Hymenobacter glacieicola TaxID=1562124 RepID=A0ABQ1X8A7_9BACT|nr:type II toxin-antitoxin system HigB family toxin [Hymenobacter glacieicola]GGG62498.1 toxin RelE [Hymenobacter glacieicola]